MSHGLGLVSVSHGLHVGWVSMSRGLGLVSVSLGL